QYGESLQAGVEAIYEFNCGLIDALCDVVPAVKPQSAYYENLGWRGMEMLERTIRYARQRGLYVVADIKRGDIGATATAYSEGWLGRTAVGESSFATFDADCVTLNGYMGSDAIAPFLKDCVRYDKCVFALVRTSNKSAVELQDRLCGQQHIYEIMGELTQTWAGDDVGSYGFNRVGAVTGATYPEQIKLLRAQLPHTFFLVPGYGAQGGTAEDVRYAFDENGHGAIVNSSRGIMCAWKKTGNDGADYQDAARAAALEMRDAITAITPILD
ncbi:MAG: orotidine-5'-phosphate decarboxylase, partial [Clostridiales bacterium]|nr:orotidine-5'-phosphate decarboxylase [Clostridiales bacterium]